MKRPTVALTYLEETHCSNNSCFHSGGAGNVELSEEMVGDSHQCVLWPTLEPVHGTA